MYGVWFTDYLPYLQIARLHVRLGNWACARDALRVSQELKEVTKKDREFHEFEELQQEALAGQSSERRRP
jgi:hypothetical protein